MLDHPTKGSLKLYPIIMEFESIGVNFECHQFESTGDKFEPRRQKLSIKRFIVRRTLNLVIIHFIEHSRLYKTRPF